MKPTPANRNSKRRPPLSLSQLGPSQPGSCSAASAKQPGFASSFRDFSKFVDPSGKLNFSGKAVLHSAGVDFSSGHSYKINLQDIEPQEELGRGQYGIVQKVLYKPTNVMMAMKEIRLELSSAKLNQILMEMDVLHKSKSPYIVDFYGAFFVESCVYLCLEFMDAGSIDKLYAGGISEKFLCTIALSIVRGLQFLKDELSIIHRDVKPTNILINTKGQVKLCDFGVSGQLIASLAKTNIGCQSYMAVCLSVGARFVDVTIAAKTFMLTSYEPRQPERFTPESTTTYTAASDVWSLGLSLVEMAYGYYPYPASRYDSLFAQLNAIVQGQPPSFPPSFSREAHDFVEKCLHKNPKERPSYAELLDHPWLKRASCVVDCPEGRPVQKDMGAATTQELQEWVLDSLQRRKEESQSPPTPSLSNPSTTATLVSSQLPKKFHDDFGNAFGEATAAGEPLGSRWV